MNIQPFAALRPQPTLAAQVAAPPYDVLNSTEAKNYAKGNPYSFLQVTKSEIDLPSNIDVHSQEVYNKANENLQKLIANNTLIQEEKPCYYIYQLTMQGRSQTGLVCVSSIQDYHNGTIKKHEYTRPEKEQDRIQHMLTINAQTGNVFLACNDVPSLNNLINTIKQNAPLYNFETTAKVGHKVWIVNTDNDIATITAIVTTQVPCTYIADGHHRAASAAKVSASKPYSKAAQYFLTTIFPASELAILDYNRVVKDLNGLSVKDFLNKIEPNFTVTPSATPVKPTQVNQFGMYIAGHWYTLTALPNTATTNPVGLLDVSLLQHYIIDKVLGITDVRTDNRIDFVGGIRGMQALIDKVNNGEAAVAFSLYPVSIQQLFTIADSGAVMPPKSTWFEPKLADGLLTHLL